jgi:hypothetical protein
MLVTIFLFVANLLASTPPAELSVEKKFQKCEEFYFVKDLPVYKDPSTWEMDQKKKIESPLLTTLKGTQRFMKVNDGFFVKSFLDKSELLKMFPVKICGPGAYTDTLGFVFEKDFVYAQIDESRAKQLPPSTKNNPIPKF